MKNHSKIIKPSCLNTIRILAALQVVVGHSMNMGLHFTKIEESIIFFFSGVPIFFALSGFLIWESLSRSANNMEFLKKRFCRLFPELWVAVLVEILVIILLYKKPLELIQLFVFGVCQGTFFQFWTPDFLRDYGCGCPNGALWTICVILQFYIIACLVLKKMTNKGQFWWLLIIFASILLGVLSKDVETDSSIAYKFYLQSIIPYFWMFLIGCYISKYKKTILNRCQKYWILLILASIFSFHFGFDLVAVRYGLLHSLLLFLGCLGFAYSFPVLDISKDISYAIYIYHMTIMNAFIEIGLVSSYVYFIIVLILTLIISYISTITIGKYSMKLRNILLNK